MRDLGTVVRGIRTPIIKENDDLANIVVESVLNASKNLSIQPLVLDLAGNIHIYQELVNEVRFLAESKIKKGKRLPNNNSLDEFI